jgi:hypothetical protein
MPQLPQQMPQLPLPGKWGLFVVVLGWLLQGF